MLTQETPMPERYADWSIDKFHAQRTSGFGCPETDGGPHYFAFIDPSSEVRICIDCGEQEPVS